MLSGMNYHFIKVSKKKKKVIIDSFSVSFWQDFLEKGTAVGKPKYSRIMNFLKKI